jgi:hypothetical protein
MSNFLDRAPKPGYVFLVSECANHDNHADWFLITRSFQEATDYYQKARELSAPFLGLYPDKGVCEVTKATAARALRTHDAETMRILECQETREEALLALRSDEYSHEEDFFEAHGWMCKEEDESELYAESM